VPKAGHDCIVFTEVARQVQEGHREIRPAGEPATDLRAVVGAAVVDEDDLVPARDLQLGKRIDQDADRGCATVDGNDDGQRVGIQGFIHLVATARSEPPKG
jgi:hypothetical protein